ncbi:hypothetical protein BDY17DRAFT_297336 [Neohortaea acidophila]|uniref:TAFII28-like protein domain-containing protein n=1 Tax=Neohortaea acidophila TaxID=245834 RepID=A0A6A6PTQ8_9PEZI|nr:uncharacterized protein BDY17DRAFT_297336 [Neohortaea acidophila]KAF2483372.1 hypothetical protein BDY17DRAFT_297336 [Neohortaea acidophila]
MASPPPSSATSPPAASPLALPRQRPTLSLQSQSSHTRRPSPLTASAHNSAHPLRQTSFPPPDSLEAQHAAAEDAVLRYSPTQTSQGSPGADMDDDEEFSDSEIMSAISGVGDSGASRKRKRGEKRARGRPSKAHTHARASSVSLVNGERERSSRGGTAGAASLAGDEDEEDEDDDLAPGAGGGRAPLYAGGELTEAEVQAADIARASFRTYMERLDRTPLTATRPSRAGLTVNDMADRFDVQYRAKLHKNDLRKLVNQTLSQSVPGNVVLVVGAYTKMFAMDLIEEARKVQREWAGVESKRADGGENAAFDRLNHALQEQRAEEENEPPTTQDSRVTEKDEKANKSSSSPAQTNVKETKEAKPPQSIAEALSLGGAGGLQSSFLECDRGPLLPDHLREALRRYKKSRAGGTVGFTGLSLEGREVAAPRMGGRRLFR